MFKKKKTFFYLKLVRHVSSSLIRYPNSPNCLASVRNRVWNKEGWFFHLKNIFKKYSLKTFSVSVEKAAHSIFIFKEYHYLTTSKMKYAEAFEMFNVCIILHLFFDICERRLTKRGFLAIA